MTIGNGEWQWLKVIDNDNTTTTTTTTNGQSQLAMGTFLHGLLREIRKRHEKPSLGLIRNIRISF